jgi:uncharacterized membrane protein YccC
LLLCVVTGVLLAILLAAVIYGALVFALLRWLYHLIDRTLKSFFGKAARVKEPGIGPAPPVPTEEASPSEDFDAAYEAEWKRREAARGKWLQ